MILYWCMYLKKLELNGFKSFATPASLEFSSGITAIVGPNGSGKSNIADAVRWILGEQSMKNIRSQNSRDLIFSGSKSRSRLGKASVYLCFDNSSGCIPLDFSEVIVSRNIFRDGTSEYFINKSLTRQMDVVEILAKANIGHRGFSVINQGMEAEMLKYSPSELYELLEEASGVRYLQLKKRRSERRLKITQTNLEKVSSILTELKPHLRYLKKEATKAEQREKLKQKLSHFQEQFFFSKIVDLERQGTDLDKEKKGLEIKISGLKKEIFQLNSELKQQEAAIEDGRKKFINAQKELEEVLDEKVKLSEQLANLRTRVQTKNERQPVDVEREFKHIHQVLKKILEFKDLNKIKEEINKVLNQIEKIIGGEQPVRHWPDPRVKDLERLLAELNQKYEEQKKVLRADQTQLGQDRFFELERALRKKKDDLSDLESKMREITWTAGRSEEDFKELKQEITRTALNWEEIKAKKIEKTSEPLEQLEEQINHLKYKIEEIGSVDEITLQEYKETKERYEKLSKKLEDLTRAKKNLEDLIKQLSKEIRGQFEKNLQAINGNFNKYLRLLFGGGRGYLKQISNLKSLPCRQAGQISKIEEGQEELSEEDLATEEIEPEDEERVVSKGIEIKATLPGKKIDDLRMFSGGEKALTSIALLFAIIGVNPPPFLVLDEVDATLDESNSQRFAKLLREFSKDTQFVIITHNRETMNQADVLYGVTMGDDGVSKLLSLKLER